jgi:hypothetical protein
VTQLQQWLEFWRSGVWRLRLPMPLGTGNNVAPSLKNFTQQNHRSRDEGGTLGGLCHCKFYDKIAHNPQLAEIPFLSSSPQ